MSAYGKPNDFDLEEPTPRWPIGADRPPIVLGGKDAVSDELQAASCPLFCGLTLAEHREISALARIKEFKRGEMLHLEGDAITRVYLIISGLVKILKIGTNGSEVTLRLSCPGDVIIDGHPLCVGDHGTSAQVLRLSRVMIWDAFAFRTRVEPLPVMHRNVMRIVAAQMLELEDRFSDMATMTVGQRTARQVVRLARQIGKPMDGGIEIALSREEMAQMMGTTLFTVSRLFSTWEAIGILKPRREAVLICNLSRLMELSEAG